MAEARNEADVQMVRQQQQHDEKVKDLQAQVEKLRRSKESVDEVNQARIKELTLQLESKDLAKKSLDA